MSVHQPIRQHKSCSSTGKRIAPSNRTEERAPLCCFLPLLRIFQAASQRTIAGLTVPAAPRDIGWDPLQDESRAAGLETKFSVLYNDMRGGRSSRGHVAPEVTSERWRLAAEKQRLESKLKGG